MEMKPMNLRTEMRDPHKIYIYVDCSSWIKNISRWQAVQLI